MANYGQDWDELGKRIQDVVDRAVNSRDYQKLEQTIRQVIDRAANAGNEAIRNVSNSAVQKKVALYGRTGGKKALAVLKTVGGSILSLATFTVLVGALVLNSLGMSLTSLAGLGAGIWLTSNGAQMMSRLKRFDIYRRALGEKTHCALETLAAKTGKTVRFVRREVQKMIGEGLFLQGHMDHEQTLLITSDETYQKYEQGRKALEERQRQAAEERQTVKESEKEDTQVREVLDKGNDFIREIRKCNDLIPGEEISAKISRMEMIVQRIFRRAEEHPEIIPDLKKLMDYYLPMTVKLLGAYADMDAQPVQGETIQTSKREIEASLDTLNAAFEKLLDSVFAETALDVSSDITVLNTMLAQEGLVEDEISKMRKQNI